MSLSQESNKKEKENKTEKGKKRRLERNERGTQNILRTGFLGSHKGGKHKPRVFIKVKVSF